MHLGWGYAIGLLLEWWQRCLRWKCYFRSPQLWKDFRFVTASSPFLPRQKMHWVASHSIEMESERPGGSKTDNGFTFRLSLMSKAEGFGRRGRLASCKRQRAVKALMASTRYQHFSSRHEVAKVKSAWMTQIYSIKAYSSAWIISSSTTGKLFSCRWISSTGCSFLYLATTSFNRAFSCRRLVLRWLWYARW